MIELSRHIESLMLKHDCVIVPGLGGFVTQYVPARRVEEEELFLPPCRSVGFNQQLTLNDGLLVQSYMQAYDTNYPETLKLINDAVAQLKHKLREDGEYELPGIGVLSLGVGGRYDFCPCEAGVLSPELYGLDAFTQSKANRVNNSAEVDEKSDFQRKNNVKLTRTERSYTISVNREFVNYVAAAIVAVVCYFLWTPTLNTNAFLDQQVASTVSEQLFASKGNDNRIALQQTKTKDIVPLSSANEKNLTSKATVQQVKATASSVDIKPINAMPLQGKYTLVLASSITLSNAKAFAQQLQEAGYKEAMPYQHKHMVRVIYGYYPTQVEAYAALKHLRKNKDFAEAWILELK